MDEYTEPVVICKEDDLKENEMQTFKLADGTDILVVKQKSVVRAIGNICPHYGAPLHTGVLGQGRVRCPWHGACFNLLTGDIEDFPGMDSLPSYKVNVEESGEVKISVRHKDVGSTKRLKEMAKRSESVKSTYVIVGGGVSGGVCAETLRQEGFTGRIVMLCKENALPYDRVNVSKNMSLTLEDLQIRNMEFYKEYSIEVMLGVEATELDTPHRIVRCSNGEEIHFNKMYIATGFRPYKPSIPGADLKNVFTIRDISDSKEINSVIESHKNVVCLGSSYIAMEAACFLKDKVQSVTVVSQESAPFALSFGVEIGERILKLYEENYVAMMMKNGIKEIIGSNGKVKEVVLNDNTHLPCDLLIMGTGTVCNTDFLKESCIKLNENGSIDTDMHLMSNIFDIFVGGDIANAPVFSIANQRAQIGHYQLAQYHGRIAAINMARRPKVVRAVPFFFTMLFGKRLRYSGFGKSSDTHIEGSLDDFKFAAYYVDDYNNVMSTCTCDSDPIASQFAELQSQGKRMHLSDVVGEDDPTKWAKMLN